MSRYIDADVLRKSLDDWYGCFNWENGEIEKHTIATVIRTIDAQPTADVRPNVHGVWAWHEDEYICNCSRCDFEIDAEGCIDPKKYIAMYKFCPNCGALMSESLKWHEIGKSGVDGIQAGMKGETNG